MKLTQDLAQKRPLGIPKTRCSDNIELGLRKMVVKMGGGWNDPGSCPMAISGVEPTRYTSNDNDYSCYKHNMMEHVHFPPSHIRLTFSNHTVRTGPTLAPS